MCHRGQRANMCRIDPAIHDAALERKGCRTVIMKGRQYRGYVYVDAEAVRTKASLITGLRWRWITMTGRGPQHANGDRYGISPNGYCTTQRICVSYL
jgi:hypothetical protein